MKGRLRTAEGPWPRAKFSRREFLALGGAGLALPVLGPRIAIPDALAPSQKRVSSSLTDFVRAEMHAGKIPGLGACIVKDGEVAWTRGFGFANIRREDRADRNTAFMLASISKTIVAAAVMQAVEGGLLALDADVNDVLAFPVRTPRHPDTPITARMLLTHTSAIRDRWSVWNGLYSEGDSPISLRDFLEGYLVPGGEYYVGGQNFFDARPGNAYRYSNVGASLAAYLVEAAAGIPFDQWCEQRIFAPLGMSETDWHLAGLDGKSIAMPYRWNGDRDDYVAVGQYGYPDYPDGALRASAPQLARYLLAFIGFGALNGARILSEESVREMRRSQIPEFERGQGLIWYVAHRKGERLLGHNGSDKGVATQMFFRPRDGTGVIVLANGNWRWVGGRYPLSTIFDRLFTEAERLSGEARPD